MAAAIVTTRRQNSVFGGRRVFAADSIVFTNNGDTLSVPGMKRIEDIGLTPTTGTAYGFTVSGNTITLVSAGGLTFQGSIVGI
jgi:hypothetical protein